MCSSLQTRCGPPRTGKCSLRLPLADADVAGEDTLVGQWLVVDVARHAPLDLVAPEKVSRHLVLQQAHDLGQDRLALVRVEGAALAGEQRVEARIGVADA